MFDRGYIESIIQKYNDIVQNYEIITDLFEDNKYTLELRILFNDNSKLDNRDVYLFIDNLIKRKYKFQWMKADNSLIMRWDNAEHHRTLKNFPFHLHRFKKENVEESPEMTLESVLSFIKNFSG
ncbi:MAG TPA: DUF6516 family protein [Leptospiraceae bacterium]|nr:DUF6516 family protein [Leptospiraceae bacterium]HMW05965.1 DUF6516 family protein [Leptospiraceae bacterium]HMX32103.1 DUF6516 family protein [Leptospiraceae bacterium]HMY32319.1 DUF6516 family protein [Leptospiraceae bacterium]HMZ62479.1 DUF6516 family protein [Leptospiraceae bacterium]